MSAKEILYKVNYKSKILLKMVNVITDESFFSMSTLINTLVKMALTYVT